ncbi:hypothetical protein T492DRAFT_914479 [Pavlovales sp. CCMP2436]|nr:hypothetical protein T492DRAFT_914479 [Pavlovales sp. CCMP2436]
MAKRICARARRRSSGGGYEAQKGGTQSIVLAAARQAREDESASRYAPAGMRPEWCDDHYEQRALKLAEEAAAGEVAANALVDAAEKLEWEDCQRAEWRQRTHKYEAKRRELRASTQQASARTELVALIAMTVARMAQRDALKLAAVLLDMSENVDAKRTGAAMKKATTLARPARLNAATSSGACHPPAPAARGLIHACFDGDVGRAHLLIEAGADVHFSDEQGRTALRAASYQGQAGCARLLLEAGADVDPAHPSGVTALMDASLDGHAECARLLLEAGADVNRAVAASRTALMYASNHAECASLLLEAGADLLCAYGAQREMMDPDAPADLLPPARVRQLLVGGADVHASEGSSDGAPTLLGLVRALLVRDPAHEGAALVVAAAAPWSRENHTLFPAHARARAAELLRLGQLLVRKARFAGKEVALLDVWSLVMAHALGRSMPPHLGVVTAVSAEWESVKLELDDGERVSVPVASINLELAPAQQPGGAHRRLTVTLGGLAARPELNGRKVRLLGWVGSQGRWRVQLDRSRLAPLGVRPASLLALG